MKPEDDTENDERDEASVLVAPPFDQITKCLLPIPTFWPTRANARPRRGFSKRLSARCPGWHWAHYRRAGSIRCCDPAGAGKATLPFGDTSPSLSSPKGVPCFRFALKAVSACVAAGVVVAAGLWSFFSPHESRVAFGAWYKLDKVAAAQTLHSEPSPAPARSAKCGMPSPISCGGMKPMESTKSPAAIRCGQGVELKHKTWATAGARRRFSLLPAPPIAPGSIYWPCWK